MQSLLLAMAGKPPKEEFEEVDLGAKLAEKGLAGIFPVEVCPPLSFRLLWATLACACFLQGLASSERRARVGHEAEAAHQTWGKEHFLVRGASEVRLISVELVLWRFTCCAGVAGAFPISAQSSSRSHWTKATRGRAKRWLVAWSSRSG